MSLKNAFGIYHVITELLKNSARPLTSVEMYDFDDVKQYAKDINQVSDYLGHMWRRSLLSRYPVKGPGMARWAYSWKDPSVKVVPQQRHVQPRLVVRSTPNEELLHQVGEMQRGALKKSNVTVREDGKNLVIDTPAVTITIIVKG